MNPSIASRPLTRQIRLGLTDGFNARAVPRYASAGPSQVFLGHAIGARTIATTSGSAEKSEAAGAGPHITLYTGTDCSLCDVVKDVLHQVQKDHPFRLDYYNIRDDNLPDVQKWRRAYQYDIPVVHLNGKEIARHRLDKDTLLAKLREASSE